MVDEPIVTAPSSVLVFVTNKLTIVPNCSELLPNRLPLPSVCTSELIARLVAIVPFSVMMLAEELMLKIAVLDASLTANLPVEFAPDMIKVDELLIGACMEIAVVDSVMRVVPIALMLHEAVESID